MFKLLNATKSRAFRLWILARSRAGRPRWPPRPHAEPVGGAIFCTSPHVAAASARCVCNVLQFCKNVKQNPERYQCNSLIIFKASAKLQRSIRKHVLEIYKNSLKISKTYKDAALNMFKMFPKILTFQTISKNQLYISNFAKMYREIPIIIFDVLAKFSESR